MSSSVQWLRAATTSPSVWRKWHSVPLGCSFTISSPSNPPLRTTVFIFGAIRNVLGRIFRLYVLKIIWLKLMAAICIKFFSKNSILSIGRERIMSMAVLWTASLRVTIIAVRERTCRGGHSVTANVDYFIFVNLRWIDNTKYSTQLVHSHQRVQRAK